MEREGRREREIEGGRDGEGGGGGGGVNRPTWVKVKLFEVPRRVGDVRLAVQIDGRAVGVEYNLKTKAKAKKM